MLKNIFQNFSIRIKLIFLFALSAGVALLLATTSSFIYNLYEDKNSVVKESIKLAQVSGKNIAASLMFEDRESARSILQPILNDKNVYSIKIYDTQGHLFTTIGNSTLQLNHWSADKFASQMDINISVTWDYIDVLTSIIHNNVSIGFLQIISSTDIIKKNMLEQGLVSLIISLFTLLIVLLLAFWFEKIFSRPIYELLHAVKEIKDHPEFNIYLVSHTKDEFDELYTEFNRMTHEIKKRDNLLKEHNINLKNLVSSTNEELVKTQTNLDEVFVLANTDPLTNLSNRRNAMEQFDLLIDEAYKNDWCLGVIMLDIDHFKQVNDNFGHQAGDIVLKEVSELLQKNARDNDFVGRIGGEEFLILCQNSDVDTTHKVAERIRRNVEQKIFYYEEEQSIQVTISLGFCSAVPQLNSREKLIKIADNALYQAKGSGRNQVTQGFI